MRPIFIAVHSMKIKHSLPISAFTLMELLIVVIILGILVTIATPIYTKVVERSRIPEAYSQFGLIKQAEISFYTEHNGYVGQWNSLDMDNPNNSPNRYFDYELFDPTVDPRSGIAQAVRRLDYMNPFGFDYRLLMNTNWVITVNGF